MSQRALFTQFDAVEREVLQLMPLLQQSRN
jgi:hypothetical protein